MDNKELLRKLESGSALKDVPYWNAVLIATRNMRVDTGGYNHFCQMLAKFIETNFEFYTMPENMLTGTLPEGAESA
jgi:hypothetical protein